MTEFQKKYRKYIINDYVFVEKYHDLKNYLWHII